MWNYTRNEWGRFEKLTRNEWRRCETTLETGGEDVKTTLETSVNLFHLLDVLCGFCARFEKNQPVFAGKFLPFFIGDLPSFQVTLVPFFTLVSSVFFTSSPLVSSVFFSSFPLVSSVFFTSFPLVSSVVFTSFPLVSSVFLPINIMTMFGFAYCLASSSQRARWLKVSRLKTTLETSGEDVKTTLETSGEDVKLHPKRVEKMWNHTRNEWGRLPWNVVNQEGTTRSSIVAPRDTPKRFLAWKHTRNEWKRLRNTLETSGEDLKIHSKRVEKTRGVPNLKLYLFCVHIYQASTKLHS